MVAMESLSDRVKEPCWRDGWYRVPHEVTWRDLDGIGHVNNAVFFSYFEWARAKYWLDFRETEEPNPLSIEFIVAHAECDFLLQLELAEKIEITARISEIRNTSFDFEHEIWNGAGNLAARGRVVAVLFDWEKNQKRSFGSELKRRVAAFQREEGEQNR